MVDKMKRWCCDGCPQSEPCFSSGVKKPYRCPYGTDENMKWVDMARQLNTKERRKTVRFVVQHTEPAICEFCGGTGIVEGDSDHPEAPCSCVRKL